MAPKRAAHEHEARRYFHITSQDNNGNCTLTCNFCEVGGEDEPVETKPKPKMRNNVRMSNHILSQCADCLLKRRHILGEEEYANKADRLTQAKEVLESKSKNPKTNNAALGWEAWDPTLLIQPLRGVLRFIPQSKVCFQK
jgi:hypothetical protein